MSTFVLHPSRWCVPGRIARRGRSVALIALCVAALGLLSASPVSATNILTANANFNNLVLVDATFNGQAGTFYAGIQNASLNGGPTFDAYCVDLYHTNFIPVSYPVTLLSVTTLTDPPITSGATGMNGGGVAYLYDVDAAGASNDKVKAAALQVAIWTLEYDISNKKYFVDTDTPVNGGSTQQQVAYQANLYLTDYANNYKAGVYDATWFKAAPHNGNLYQDLVGPSSYLPVGPLNATPEPSTFLTAAIGILAGLGYWRRCRAARAIG